MDSKLIFLAVCLIATVFLAGCGEGKDVLSSIFGSGNSSGEDNIISANLAGGNNSGGSGIAGSSPDDSGNSGGLEHLPEPATLILLGSGLLAYALFRRRKK